MGYPLDAVGLDPHLSTALSSELMFQFVYSGLLKTDNSMAVHPDLAESWEVSEDGKVYTFNLRDNAKFHNGRTVTSDDVIYSFERALGAKTAFSARFSVVESIDNPDDKTVVFRLKQPFAPFLSIVATTKAAIVPKEAVEANGDLQTTMVGTGPFRFVSYRPGTSLILDKFDNYYDGDKPYLDRIELQIIPDEVTRVAALRTGAVDFTQLADPLSERTLEGLPNIRIDTVPMLRRHVVLLNVNEPPLNDVRVRQAITIGIDRQQIIDLALGGTSEISGPFPPGLSQWALPLDQVPLYREAPNIERAKALLAEAGFADGLRLKTFTTNTMRAAPVAEILREQLGKLNITFDLEVLEWGTLLDRWGKSTFQTITMPYIGRSDPYYYTYERLHSSSPGNVSKLSDPEVDQLSELGAETVDPEKRKEIYDDLQKRMAEVSAIVYLATETEQFAMKDAVKGYVGMPDGGRNYIADIWLSSSCK